MATIITNSELVRRAIRYLDEVIASGTDKNLAALLDEAGMRFNLGPADACDLERIFRERAILKS